MTTQNWPQDPLVPSTTGTDYESGTTQAGQSTTSVAKGQAKEVGKEGAGAAQHVAQTAASEAKNVAAEAGTQAKNLVSGLGSDIKSQAGAQQQKATEGLRSISDELRSMADKSDNKMVSNLVQQASQRTSAVAGWLENRDATDILDDVKGFARRRPGAFLAIAAGAGLVVGRLTRGLTGAQADAKSDQDRLSGTPGTDYGTPSYAGTATSMPQTSRGNHVAESSPAFVDPAADYPTIPPGTPPVGTLPDERDLR
ncbi:hypothetical protein [Arthrobacter zhaoguopingii]|uniref:hypothetical protein n=1 Tax=Arthrobacter zhaoguopingii TaxID=2681491 RepID=UPI001358E706|nr:hypothetical protein [Arthrobacter zhaoguopingii]